MVKTKGFTLIELVVVIVILGILAVTAAPKFLNLTTDARNASLRGLNAAIVNSIEISHAKLAIDKLEEEPSVWSFTNAELKSWCDNCLFMYGAPGNSPNTWQNIVDGVVYGPEATEFRVGSIAGEATAAVFSTPENFNDSQVLTADNCYIKYTPATKDTEYQIELVECN